MQYDLQRELAWIAGVLKEEQGTPEVRLHDDPLDSIIRVILSQSTSDVNSGRAYRSLKARFPAWQDVLEAGIPAIADAIRSGGLANQKSTRIHALLERIHEERGGLGLDDLCMWDDERVFQWLGSFEGIGVKSIAVVLLFACGRDVCPVDTHVHRIAKRLGLVRERAGADETFWKLKEGMPEGEAAVLHINLIRFGKTRCTARAPACNGCPLVTHCRYDQATGRVRPRGDE